MQMQPGSVKPQPNLHLIHSHPASSYLTAEFPHPTMKDQLDSMVLGAQCHGIHGQGSSTIPSPWLTHMVIISSGAAAEMLRICL